MLGTLSWISLGFYLLMGGFSVSDPIQRLKAYIDWNTRDIAWPHKLAGVPNLDYGIDRFGLARSSRKDNVLGPDEIVLLRQAVRWSGMPEIRVDRPSDQPDEMVPWWIFIRGALCTRLDGGKAGNNG